MPLRLPLTTYSCTFCSFRSSNGIEYVKHLFQAHTFEPNFRYVCGISSCTHVFTTGASYDAFRGHCTRKHHNWKNCFIPTIDVEEVWPGDHSGGSSSDASTEGVEAGGVFEDCSSTDQDMDDNDFDVSQSVYSPNECESECVGPDNVKMAAAKFLLTLKERFKLTQASLDYTIKAVEEMMLLSANVYRQYFVENRELASIPFDQHSSLANPFVGLKTEYQQTKFFTENFGVMLIIIATKLLS